MSFRQLGNWKFDGMVLKPKSEELQSFCVSLAAQRGEDPLVHFHFADSSQSEPLQIQRSLLISCGGPLASLVSGPFMEARKNVVHMPCESRASFEVLRQFLYCLPVDFTNVSADVPMVADKWDLRVLFDAYFLALEENDPDIGQLCEASLPAMVTVQVPNHFKRFFVHRFSSEIANVQLWLGDDMWQDDHFRISVADDCEEEAMLDFARSPTVLSTKMSPLGGEHQDTAKHQTHVDDGSKEDHGSEVTRSETGDDKYSVESKSSDAVDESPAIADLKPNAVAADSDVNQISSSGYWSSESVLLYAKRNLWSVLSFQGLIPQIIRHVAIFSSTNLTKYLLDIVLRQLEGKLSDEETITILRTFDWDSAESATALQSPVSHSWSLNAWRLLARAQTGALRRGCDTVSYRWTMLGFHGRVPELCKGTYWYKEIDFQKCKFRLRVEKPSSKRCGWNGLPYLVLTVTVRNGEDLPSYYLDRKVAVRLNVIGTPCTCADEKHRKERAKQPFEGEDIDNLTIASLVNRKKVHFLLMTGKEFERFLIVHDRSCGIVMKLRMRIDDYSTRSDPINDEFGGESVSEEDTSGVYIPD